MSPKRKTTGTARKDASNYESDAEGSKGVSGSEAALPRIHRINSVDIEGHFGPEDQQTTIPKQKGRTVVNAADRQKSEPVSPKTSVRLVIDAQLWRQVQLAAAEERVEPARYLEKVLKPIFKPQR